MKKRHATSSSEGNLSPEILGRVGDVSEFIRLTAQAAFQSVDSLWGDADQRAVGRRNYPFLQRIAPILNGVMPTSEQFIEVPFSDISATGASFLWEGEFGFDHLQVELGSGSNVSLVTAQVAWVERLDASEAERSFFRVGCRWMGSAALRSL